MHRRIAARVTYANVMATIAVFGVLAGGGAYAASKIGAGDIAKNAIRPKHLSSATRELVPVAVVLVGGNGVVADEAHRPPVTGPPSVNHHIGGGYTLTFPGLTLGGNDLAICNRRESGGTGEVGAETGGAGVLQVRVSGSNGAQADASFQCAVYDL